ncbi:MAG TPA: hypothetical protein VF832_15795, partial [Longimicrobiales bacterium]
MRTAAVAAAGAFAGGLRGVPTLHRASAEDVLRVALVLPDGPAWEQARRGVTMGVEEAQRTAQLFNRQIELVSAPAGTDAGA